MKILREAYPLDAMRNVRIVTWQLQTYARRVNPFHPGQSSPSCLGGAAEVTQRTLTRPFADLPPFPSYLLSMFDSVFHSIWTCIHYSDRCSRFISWCYPSDPRAICELYTIDNLNKQCGEPMGKKFLPRCIDHYVVAIVGLGFTNTQTLVRRVSHIQKTAENVVDVILPANQPQCDLNQQLRPRSSLSTSAASSEITYLTRSSDPGEIRPVQESFKHGDQSIRVT